MKPLLWCDIESSGLDANRHDLLEIALAATNENLEIEDEICLLVRHDQILWNSETTEIHLESGLLARLRTAEHSLSDVENQILSWVGQRFKGRMLASTSPHSLDLPFLEQHMPRLRACFHAYRIFDVRTLLTLFEDEEPGKPHRALDDLHRDIELVRSMKSRING